MRLTIVIRLLEVHVNNPTGPYTGHVVTIDGLDFCELTGLDCVASILGEESRHRVIGKFHSPLIIARFGVGGSAAPRVNVVSPEIDGISSITTVEVVCQIQTDACIVIGSITHADGSVVFGLDICLHVTNRGLHESTGGGVVDFVRDLITGEKAKDVCIVGHSINDGGIISEEFGVPFWRVSVDRGRWVGKILDNVNSVLLQKAHAGTVIERGINGIDPDDICTQLLQERNIAGAASFIRQRVCESAVAGRSSIRTDILLICNTSDEELCTVFVEEMGSLMSKTLARQALLAILSCGLACLNDDWGQICCCNRFKEEGAAEQCCGDRSNA